MCDHPGWAYPHQSIIKLKFDSVRVSVCVYLLHFGDPSKLYICVHLCPCLLCKCNQTALYFVTVYSFVFCILHVNLTV